MQRRRASPVKCRERKRGQIPEMASVAQLASSPNGESLCTIGPAQKACSTIMICRCIERAPTRSGDGPASLIATSMSELIQPSVPISVVASSIVIRNQERQQQQPAEGFRHCRPKIKTYDDRQRFMSSGKWDRASGNSSGRRDPKWRARQQRSAPFRPTARARAEIRRTRPNMPQIAKHANMADASLFAARSWGNLHANEHEDEHDGRDEGSFPTPIANRYALRDRGPKAIDT